MITAVNEVEAARMANAAQGLFDALRDVPAEQLARWHALETNPRRREILKALVDVRGAMRD